MTTKIRIVILAAIAVLAFAALAAPGAALAKKSKKATLTLVVNGGDFSGAIKDKKHPQCIADREVYVRPAGQSPAPLADDEGPIGPMDTTDASGQWNTGNNGAYDGDYYAFAPATPGCKALTSKIATVTGRGTPEDF
ncbi:MAG: hypothetical protein QOG62_568 [Thermoleophilaceae bacterium]|jgi:hypothetical protein|nr:hypothetical protein [Thermoleophilaceae bacterium]